MPFSTRPAGEGDAPALARIYAAAGAMFAGTRHAAAAEGPPPDPAAFARLAAEGRILAACTPEGAVAGFLGHLPATLADGRPCLHVAELDMDPAHQRRGGARALLEAAACGLPAVTSTRGALPEIVVDGETGLLVEEEPDALAGAWESLLADAPRRERMGAAARRRAEIHFDRDRFAERVEAFYASLR